MLHDPFFLTLIVNPVLVQAGPLVLRRTGNPGVAVAPTVRVVPMFAVAGSAGDHTIV